MQIFANYRFCQKFLNTFLPEKNPDFAQAIKTNTRAAYEINAIESIDAVIDVSGFAYSDSCLGKGGCQGNPSLDRVL